jgi:hypothetical protein
VRTSKKSKYFTIKSILYNSILPFPFNELRVNESVTLSSAGFGNAFKEATLETLEELYDKVQPGGYIIFDDSCLYETLDAIKTFFKQRNLPEFINHPVTDQPLDINVRHTNDDSGLPAGCYIIK